MKHKHKFGKWEKVKDINGRVISMRPLLCKTLDCPDYVASQQAIGKFKKIMSFAKDEKVYIKRHKRRV